MDCQSETPGPRRGSILRHASYRRQDFEHALIRSRPQHLEKYRSLLLQSTAAEQQNPLGLLGRLPLELMLEVTDHLDIKSYCAFRQVNRFARQIATSSPQYRAVVTHGGEAFRALLRTGLAPNFAVRDLYRCLITQDCELCGAFGGFLFLPTATRCCYTCLTTSSRLRLVTTLTLASAAKVSPARILELFPVLNSIPDVYSELRVSRWKSVPLVVEEQAMEKLRQLGLVDDEEDAEESDTASSTTSTRKPIPSPRVLRFMGAVAFPSLDSSNALVTHGVSCKGCKISKTKTHSSDAASSSEESDTSSDEDSIPAGFDTARRRSYHHRMYSDDQFLEHFAECTHAQEVYAEGSGKSLQG